MWIIFSSNICWCLSINHWLVCVAGRWVYWTNAARSCENNAQYLRHLQDAIQGPCTQLPKWPLSSKRATRRLGFISHHREKRFLSLVCALGSWRPSWISCQWDMEWEWRWNIQHNILACHTTNEPHLHTSIIHNSGLSQLLLFRQS